MRNRFKTAMGAVLAVAVLAPIAGLVGAPAVTANDISESADTLVPQAVMAAAISEERSIPDNIYLPELGTKPRDEAPSARAPGVSLAELVASHAATDVSGRDMECLAGAVYFESKSEPLTGQLAVAEVILNRSRSGRFPASICGVVFQPSQFSFVRSGGFPPIARSSQDWREAVAIADIAMKDLSDSGVGDSLFFHARHVSPGWKLRRVAAVGNHIFYR